MRRVQLAAVMAGMAALAAAGMALAEPVEVTVKVPGAPTPASAFKMGTGQGPQGEVGVNGVSLLRDGKPWLAVMGEFHYTRYPADGWKEELLKMKAGGITLVSTYVFWIHHEEKEGVWDWSGDRDLHRFVETCREVGLPVIVRMGPWCHGEVRNGGIPEWVLSKGLRLRSEDAGFMALAKALYEQISGQLKGELWKEGGPVIGVQVDNEFGGPASYLLALKATAREAGIDVPVYTRTGWPALRSPMPFGEILPLFGGYAEGFWDRELRSMPGSYWQVFTFAPERTDTAVGTDVLGNRAKADEANTQRYPYLTCELGGGMMTSYHRRIHIDPRDAYSLELVKVGSGSNLPGFYMYHGGTNPDAAEPGFWLQEFQASKMTNSNDMPVKTYDFQAPLGEFGQVREPYYLLKRTHLFLADWGAELAPMTTTFSERKVTKQDDLETLRWAARSDGKSGFVFVNNYQRGVEMPVKKGVQFRVNLADGGTAMVPGSPVDVPGGASLMWPFNMPLAGGAVLEWATAQPVCRVAEGDETRMVFSEITGIPAEFSFAKGAEVQVGNDREEGRARVKPGVPTEITVRQGGKTTRILVMPEKAATNVWRGRLAGKERIIYSPNDVTLTEAGGVLRTRADETLSVMMWPQGDIAFTGKAAANSGRGSSMNWFTGMATVGNSELSPVAATLEKMKDAGPPREIAVKQPRGNAIEPSDADFEQAAVWRVKLPAGIDPERNLLLRFHYAGDVARIALDGKLLTDNFYNGTAFDLGLKRYGARAYTGELLLKVLPLKKGAPVYIQKEDLPDFGDKESICELKGVEVLETREATFTVH
jgi:hypothetical protein